MKLNDICRKVAKNELGKPGMMVEAMVNSFYLKKGTTMEVVDVSTTEQNTIKLSYRYNNTGIEHGEWYNPLKFRKAPIYGEY